MKRLIALLSLLACANGAQAATQFNLSRATVWYSTGYILDTAADAPVKLTGTMTVDGTRLVQKVTATANGQANTVTLTGTVTAYDGVRATVRDDRGPSYLFAVISNGAPFITLATTADFSEVDQWMPAANRSADGLPVGREYVNPPGVALGDLPSILRFLESVQQ